MRCIYCGDSMVVVDRYNPPYPEPKETVYYCEHCKIKASDNEAYGVEFDELDDDDDDLQSCCEFYVEGVDCEYYVGIKER